MWHRRVLRKKERWRIFDWNPVLAENWPGDHWLQLGCKCALSTKTGIFITFLYSEKAFKHYCGILLTLTVRKLEKKAHFLYELYQSIVFASFNWQDKCEKLGWKCALSRLNRIEITLYVLREGIWTLLWYLVDRFCPKTWKESSFHLYFCCCLKASREAQPTTPFMVCHVVRPWLIFT